MPRVLVSDPIADAGVALLRNVEGFEVDVKLGLKPEELKAIIVCFLVIGGIESEMGRYAAPASRSTSVAFVARPSRRYQVGRDAGAPRRRRPAVT